MMGLLELIWPVGIGALLLVVLNFAYLAWYVRWEARNTAGMAYYGRPLAERRAFKARIRRYAAPAMPLVNLLARGGAPATMPTFEYDGVCGPPKVSSPQVFERAARYVPRPDDVFVVTQMRCGTTWMQQVVYEIVTRGRGDLVERGQHLYAISPWIDSGNSVDLDAAPLVGTPPRRIIKSHLPTKLCPYGADAKYIYVTRHPASCFASIVDFHRSLQGPFMPSVAAQADWFCSDRMYWLPWPAHVGPWWEWAQQRPNVLFVHFEEMKSNLPKICAQVATFLGQDLSEDELARVVERSSFGYMKTHEAVFEMAPPTMFSAAGGEFMVSGKSSRHDDLPAATRQRIVAYCRESLRGTPYGLHTTYPDLNWTLDPPPAGPTDSSELLPSASPRH